MAYKGEIFALMVAMFWAFTAFAFEDAVKRVGTVSVNIIRLLLGFLFIGLFTLIYYGHFFPIGASVIQWKYLLISGLIGFFIGDTLLFKAFQISGAGLSMLIMTLAPAVAAISAWFILGEKMAGLAVLGSIITITGIAIVVAPKRNEWSSFKSYRGLIYAFGGACGQGLGIVFSKLGMGSYNAFAATQIRIIAGFAGFIVFALAFGRIKNMWQVWYNKPAMKSIIIGSFFGPFLGVSFSLLAIQYTSAGIASTIMSIVPVLLLLYLAIFKQQSVQWKEWMGAFICISGVSLLFLH